MLSVVNTSPRAKGTPARTGHACSGVSDLFVTRSGVVFRLTRSGENRESAGQERIERFFQHKLSIDEASAGRALLTARNLLLA